MRFVVALLTAGILCAGSEFKVKDFGKTVVISPEKAPATVVVFVSALCPIFNSYMDRLNEFYRTYTGKGVQFVFVNPNVNESAQDVAEHAKANRLAFPVYTDPDQSLSDLLHAQMTPEVFVFDQTGALRYHGRIDDAVNAARVRSHDLKDVLEAMLAGRMDSVLRETRAFGCTIKRRRGRA